MNLISAIRFLFISYLAILPLANTTALRNLFILMLLLLFVVQWLMKKGGDVYELTTKIPHVLWLCVLFFTLYPWTSHDSLLAWRAVTGQWGQTLLAWLFGFAFVMSTRNGPTSLKSIALACAFIVMFYFFQLMLVLIGLYGSSGHELRHIAIGDTTVAIKRLFFEGLSGWGGGIPFPFFGYDVMHGNLGYAGTVVVALASVQYWGKKPNSALQDWGILALILACLTSAVMISSRGALIFDFLMIGSAWLLAKHTQSHADKAVVKTVNFEESQNRYWHVAVWVIGVTVAIALLGKTIAKDERWQLMTTKMQAGWLVEDPVSYMCHGFKEGEREQILRKLGVSDPETVKKITEGFEQDAARVLLHQVGWQLVKENPLGIDGSRQSYEKAIAAKCGGQPVNTFAHAHNGWINLALSFGWLGALLYFALLAQMAQQGWKYARAGVALPWSSALFLVAFFWIIRGITDACYQDHYLQMQGVLLGFLYMRTRVEAEVAAKDSPIAPRPA